MNRYFRILFYMNLYNYFKNKKIKLYYIIYNINETYKNVSKKIEKQ